MRMRQFALVACVAILMATACSDDDNASGTVELPDGAAQVVEDYYQTVAVEHDGDGMMALVTDDFEFVSGTESIDSETWAGQINRFYDSFTVDRLEDATVVGGESEYLVSQPEHVTASGMDDDAFSVLRVIEVDGTWLIDMHQYIPA